MIIEYIGEVIRNELAECREKRYEAAVSTDTAAVQRERSECNYALAETPALFPWHGRVHEEFRHGADYGEIFSLGTAELLLLSLGTCLIASLSHGVPTRR